MGEEERASSVVHARYTDSISPIGHYGHGRVSLVRRRRYGFV